MDRERLRDNLRGHAFKYAEKVLSHLNDLFGGSVVIDKERVREEFQRHASEAAEEVLAEMPDSLRGLSEVERALKRVMEKLQVRLFETWSNAVRENTGGQDSAALTDKPEKK